MVIRMENLKGGEEYGFIKNRYYPGKLLHASDFIREQEYGNAKLEFLNRSFHGWGIIRGLEVGNGENGVLRITAGSAIDRRGRIIVVPEDVEIGAETLEELGGEISHGFVLGLRYEERQVGRERSLLCEKETYEDARIAESYGLGAYSDGDWEGLKAGGELTDVLTEERILYEDSEVRLSLCIPRVVPADSIFKIRIQARALKGNIVGIGWRCTVKLQGAFFLTSGKSLQILEEQRTSLLGSLYQEWQICTEEYRKQGIAMELSRLEIFRNGAEPVTAEACQIYIETAEAYEEAVRRRLPEGQGIRESSSESGALPGSGALSGDSTARKDWIPLARIGVQADRRGILVTAGETGLRRRVAQSAETEAIRRAAEENGILDIRWRGLLKNIRTETVNRKKEVYREREVHRGVAVIPVPRRYRKGDTLFSEEIAHGFPGEEVFLWLERLYEEPSYAYWEKNRTRHAAVHGAEELFADGWYSGWEIQKQALRQEIEAGTFQIALVLAKGRRKKRSREVAVSWTAVSLTGAKQGSWQAAASQTARSS